MDDLRKRTLKRHESLNNERSSWDKQWRDIAAHVLPSTGRFLAGKSNRGNKQFNRILDNEATRAVRTLGAGMMSGMTSPARPWFKLETAPELMDSHAVKVWLDEVTQRLHTVFYRANVYNALQTIYEELAVYGTAACIMQADYDNVVHLYPLTAGEYCIATNAKGEVNTLYREFDMTVAQLVDTFGADAVSQTVRSQYESGNLDEWVTVIHAIEPRRQYDHNKLDAKNMPYQSVYLEKGGQEGQVLRESGYKRFPALAPRWGVSGGDIYGTSPAMEAIGDIKQLQHQQTRKGQAIDYLTRPPIRMPTNMKNQEANLLPGGIVYGDDQGTITPLWQVGMDLQHLLADMQDVRNRIARAFYADLFLMVSQRDTQMTATEVQERHEEKMQMLGPVLERLQNELIRPLVDFVFDVAFAGGLFPPPPQELQGMELDIRLVSILAQAQRAIENNTTDRFVMGLANVAQINPAVLDRFDADAWADAYSAALGINPKIIIPKTQAEEIRAARAQQQAQAEQQAQMAQMVDAAQKLGNTPVGQGSALDGVLENLSGYN